MYSMNRANIGTARTNAANIKWSCATVHTARRLSINAGAA